MKVAVEFLKAQPHYADSFWATYRSTRCPSNHDFAAAMTSVSDENWRNFNCFIQTREQVVVRRSQIRRIGWVIKSGKPVSSGLQVPGEPGHCCARQDLLEDLPAARRFSFKMSFNCTSRHE
jgi:hypothetical protein